MLTDDQKEQLQEYFKGKTLYDPTKDKKQDHSTFMPDIQKVHHYSEGGESGDLGANQGVDLNEYITRPEDMEGQGAPVTPSTSILNPTGQAGGLDLSLPSSKFNLNYAKGPGPSGYAADSGYQPQPTSTWNGPFDNTKPTNPTPVATTKQIGRAPNSTPNIPNTPINPKDLASSQSYIEGMNEKADKYGPETQAPLLNELVHPWAQGNAGKTLGRMGTAGLGAFADAIMQGVARAGPGHNLEAINQQQNVKRENAIGLGRSLNEQQSADVQQQMQRDSLNPASPLSKSAQNAYMSVLNAAGVPKANVQNMSMGDVGKVAAVATNLKEAQARIEEAKNTNNFQALNLIDTQLNTLQQNISTHWFQNAVGTEAMNAMNSQLQELQRQAGVLLGRTGLGGGQATTTQSNSGVTVVKSQAEFDALPKGSHFIDSSGKTKVKK